MHAFQCAGPPKGAPGRGNIFQRWSGTGPEIAKRRLREGIQVLAAEGIEGPLLAGLEGPLLAGLEGPLLAGLEAPLLAGQGRALLASAEIVTNRS